MSAIAVAEADGAWLVEIRQPVLAVSLLEELAVQLDELRAAQSRRPLVLASVHPRIFLAGAHLVEIAALDRRSSAPYADRGRAVLQRLATVPGPTVAAVDGSCSGGGFDLVLSCDAVVASGRASFRHPGVVRGLVTGWSGTTRVPRAMGRAAARAAVLLAGEIPGSAAVRVGVAQALAEDPVAAACTMARALANLDPERVALWRSLRHGRFVDRFLASVVHR